MPAPNKPAEPLRITVVADLPAAASEIARALRQIGHIVDWSLLGHSSASPPNQLPTAQAVLLRTAIAPWSYLASILYHDYYWYPCVGSKRVTSALEGKWGKLFASY